MHHRTLGRSPLSVSAIGLGCMSMSGVYGRGDDAESVAVVHPALDLGVGCIGSSATGRPESGPRGCDASLKRLGVEVIDLYYQHRVDPGVPIEDTVGAMARLVEEGKVRCLGLSQAAPAPIRRGPAGHP